MCEQINFGIIAAGEGRRLRQEGAEVAKPLVKLGDEPMVGRLVRLMMECGAGRVALVLNAAMPEVAAYLESLKETWGERLVFTQASTPSSLHTLGVLAPLLDGVSKSVVTTVDTIFRQEEFLRYVEALRNATADTDALMGVTEYIDDEKPLYVEVDEPSDTVVAFRDDPWPEARYASAGIYGLSRQALALAQDCIEQGTTRMRNYQRALLAAGCGVRPFRFSKVIDVDHSWDLTKANELISPKSKCQK